MAIEIKNLKEAIKDLDLTQLENISSYILETIMGKQGGYCADEAIYLVE